MADLLPQYDNPPVTETILGIEFRPLATWGMPHFGLFWAKIREKYSKFSVQPPLPEESHGSGLIISLNPIPVVRCWFIDYEDKWLLQVQNSRFISNWKKKKDDSDYPSYTLFRDRFVEHYEQFQQFLSDENFDELSLYQAEISYINHVDIGSDFDKLPEIFPVFSTFLENSFLPVPQNGGFNFEYRMPENRGRLYINAQRVLNLETGKEFVQFTVSAKTLIASNSKEAAYEALDHGHEWVVRGFTDFTSKSMHTLWKRTQ